MHRAVVGRAISGRVGSCRRRQICGVLTLLLSSCGVQHPEISGDQALKQGVFLATSRASSTGVQSKVVEKARDKREGKGDEKGDEKRDAPDALTSARPTSPRKVDTDKPLDAGLQAMVEQAVADLLERRGSRNSVAADIEVLQAEHVTWRSSALGCPKPDRGYLMVLSPGVRIVLRTAGSEFEYHAARGGTPFLCEPPGTIEEPAPARSVSDPT